MERVVKQETDNSSSYPKSNQLDELKECLVELTLRNSYLTQRIDDLEQHVDDLSEEYDAVLKTHGDTLEQHLERIDDLDTVLATHAGKINNHTDALVEHEHKLSILSVDVPINEGNIESLCCDMEDLQRKVYQIYRFLNSVDPDFFAKIQDEMSHKGSDFCGNCTHSKTTDGICTCELSGEIIDPDSASCSMFEPPF